MEQIEQDLTDEEMEQIELDLTDEEVELISSLVVRGLSEESRSYMNSDEDVFTRIGKAFFNEYVVDSIKAELYSKDVAVD